MLYVLVGRGGGWGYVMVVEEEEDGEEVQDGDG